MRNHVIEHELGVEPQEQVCRFCLVARKDFTGKGCLVVCEVCQGDKSLYELDGTGVWVCKVCLIEVVTAK